MATVKDYIKTKLKVLKQLGIAVTDEDRERLKRCRTEYEVDRYARDLIMREPKKVVKKKRPTIVIEEEPETKNMYNITETASLLEISIRTLRRYINMGELVPCKQPPNNCRKKGRLIHIKDIMAFIEKYPKYKNTRLDLVIELYLKGEK